MARHGKQVLQREMEAHAEDQQDDADLGQIVGKALVGNVARRERAHEDTREQIPHQRRDTQSIGERAEENASTKPTTIVEISGVW